MKSNNKYLYNIYLAISISIILRLSLLNAYGDTTLEHEWGILFNNFQKSGVLSYYTSFDGTAIPTVFMPPLYAYFIFFIDMIITDKIDLVKLILILQIFLSGFSIFYFYKINLFFFLKKINIFSSYIFIFFPLYIISCLQISSISIQVFLNIFFLFFSLKIIKKNLNYKIIFLFGLVSGLTMLLRGEFIVIFLFSIIFLKIYKKINFREFMMMILICILTISPYLTRNYLAFEKITITKSLGYNLWKGNNLDSSLEGSDSSLAFESKDVRARLEKLEKNRLYDFQRDDLFLRTSLDFIKKNPKLFVERYVQKFLAFTFFNPKSKFINYNHPLNLLSLILLSVAFILSIVFYYQKKSVSYNYVFLITFLTIAIFSIFFILPRYKLIILPAQLLITNFIFAKIFIKNIKKKGV